MLMLLGTRIFNTSMQQHDKDKNSNKNEKKNIGIYDTKKTKHKTYQHKMTLKSYVFSVFFRLVLIYPHVAFDYLQEG